MICPVQDTFLAGHFGTAAPSASTTTDLPVSFQELCKLDSEVTSNY